MDRNVQLVEHAYPFKQQYICFRWYYHIVVKKWMRNALYFILIEGNKL